jgi:hypothetical protein
MKNAQLNGICFFNKNKRTTPQIKNMKISFSHILSVVFMTMVFVAVMLYSLVDINHFFYSEDGGSIQNVRTVS